jgi:hypothetical protein
VKAEENSVMNSEVLFIMEVYYTQNSIHNR